MDTVQSILNWLNDSLTPVANAMSAPLYIVGIAVIGLIFAVLQNRSQDRKFADLLAKIAVVAERQRMDQRSANEPPSRLDQQLRDVLTAMAEEDQAQARKVVDLLSNGETAKAGALSRSIAGEAEAHLGRTKMAAEEARKAAAKRWREAGVISFLSAPQEALTAFERALELDPGDPDTQLDLANLYLQQGRYQDADELFERLTLSIASPWHRASATGGLGITARARGDLVTAERWHRSAFEQFAALNDGFNQAHELVALGHVARLSGNLEQAEIWLKQAQTIYESVQDDLGIASTLSARSMVAAEHGDYDACEALIRQALALHQKINDVVGLADDYNALGMLAWRRRDLEAAERHYRHAQATYAEHGVKEGQAQALLNLAEVLIEQGKLDEAEVLLQESGALLKQVGAKESEFYVEALLARIAWKRGDHAGAGAKWRALLADARAKHMHSVAAEILRILQCDGLTEATI